MSSPKARFGTWWGPGCLLLFRLSGMEDRVLHSPLLLLPGSGFGATPWRLRISLANLKDEQYPIIGKNIMKAIGDLVAPALR